MNRTRTNIGKQKKNSSVQNVATKRLLKDLKQNELEPLPGISAAPLEKNLFVWHANLMGPKDTPWENGIFHLVLRFPSSYPDDPPTITLCTRIEHPNVIGDTVCLDMLEKKDNVDDVTKYEGWSSAYTVQSILIQLQAFLFEAEASKVLASIQNPQDYEKKKKEWLSGVKWSVEQSLQYNDKSVGHHPPRSPWPPLKVQKEAPTQTQEQLVKDELVCYYTRQTFEEDCLGYGVSYAKNLRTGEIKSIQSPLDFVSLRAYMNHDLRLSSLNEKFTHWLPIYINAKHGEKAMYLARRALSIICTGNNKNFKPAQVLSVFPKLMSTQVVDVMSGRKHASLKALRGYCFFHRMLLEFVNQYPELQEECDKIVKNFIENEKNRHKDVVPNLGEFLAFLPASKYSWSDVRDAYVDESFVRNVFWLLAKYPELEELNNKEFTDQDRLKYSFETTKTSQKLLHFQVFFLEKIAKPKGVSMKQVIEQYDANFGRPSAQLEDMFISACERINAMKDYQEFFEGIGTPNTNEQIITRLKESIGRSKEKGYHGSTLTVLSPEEFAKENRVVDLENMLKTVGDKQVFDDDDEKWRELCDKRWGFQALPDYLQSNTIQNPWRKLYLQNNLQDLLAGLNDAPDFTNLHKVLDVSSEIPRIELHMFNPTNIKSRYHFVTLIVSKIKSLDTLIIRKGEIGLDVKGFKALAKGLANNPGCLSSLILDYCGITPQSIEELTKGKLVSSNLKKLVLSGNPLGSQGAVHLSNFLRQQQNLPHLEELDLSDCKIDASGAQAIAEALLVKRELKTLRLINNPLQSGMGDIFKNLSYNPSITELDFSKVQGNFNDQGRETLAKLLKLSLTVEKLNLWKIPLQSLTPVVFDELEKNKSLKVLDMGDTNFNNMFQLGKALHKNSTLEELNLQNNNITTSQLFQMHEELKKEKGGFSLKKLILTGNQLQSVEHGKEKRKRVMGHILQIAKNLTYLDLSNCHLDKEHMISIGEALQPEFNIPLQTLLLRKNDVGKYGLKPLAQALKKNTSLKKLDLSGNDLGVLGANIVAGMLLENKGLEELNLFNNFIEIEGCIMIAEALGVNTTLTNLDLGLNRIRVRGALAIAQVLKKNNTLQKLALKHNHITDKAALELATSIVGNKNTSIKYIALAGNYLSVPTRSELALLFNQSQELQQKGFVFDLAKLVEVKDPEKQERTIYITPLPMNVTEQQIKKLFYSNRCGMCLNVSIHKHKTKSVFSKAKYAFVEFAHPVSTELAIRLVHNKKNRIGSEEVRIARAGIQNKHNQTTGPQAAPERRPQRGAPVARGGGRGGRQPRSRWG